MNQNTSPQMWGFAAFTCFALLYIEYPWTFLDFLMTQNQTEDIMGLGTCNGH